MRGQPLWVEMSSRSQAARSDDVLNAMTKLEIAIPIADEDTQFVRDAFGTLKHGRTTSACWLSTKNGRLNPAGLPCSNPELASARLIQRK